MSASTHASIIVIPANAGTQSALARGCDRYWVSAFAGMTKEGETR